jgi:hypothetical protein
MYRKTALTLGLALFSSVAAARPASYEVTITNLTPAQTFTPIVVLAHSTNYDLFELGAPASEAVETMAEGGATAMIEAEAAELGADAQSSGDLLGPGESVTVTVESAFSSQRTRISVASMLIPTNDTFIALDAVPPPRGGSDTYVLPAYDAGTEVNDQSCQHMPGPRCGGEGFSVDGGEGFIHVSNGFHDLGDTDADGFEVLSPVTYDWRNPAALVSVKRVR